MKKLIVTVLLIMPVISSAMIVSFDCKSTDILGVHVFDARGVAVVDQDNRVEGLVTIKVQKAQADDSVQIFEEIKAQGTYTHINLQNNAFNSFEQLSLVANDAYIKKLNLFLEFNNQNISQVISVDNFIYRSNCSVQSKD